MRNLTDTVNYRRENVSICIVLYFYVTGSPLSLRSPWRFSKWEDAIGIDWYRCELGQERSEKRVQSFL